MTDSASLRVLADECWPELTEPCSHLAYRTATALRAAADDLEMYVTRARDIWDNPDKWMRWCDVKVLERAEAAEALCVELKSEREEAIKRWTAEEIRRNTAEALCATLRPGRILPCSEGRSRARHGAAQRRGLP